MISTLSKKSTFGTSGNSACSFFLPAEASHCGCEGTHQGTVPLYPTAHVLGSFGPTGNKQCFFERYGFFSSSFLSQEKDVSQQNLSALGLTMDTAS